MGKISWSIKYMISITSNKPMIIITLLIFNKMAKAWYALEPRWHPFQY